MPIPRSSEGKERPSMQPAAQGKVLQRHIEMILKPLRTNAPCNTEITPECQKLINNHLETL